MEEPQATLQIATVLVLLLRSTFFFLLCAPEQVKVDYPSFTVKVFTNWMSTAVCGHVLFILFGAPLFELFGETCALSMVLASLVGLSGAFHSLSSSTSFKVICECPRANLVDHVLLAQAYGVGFGTWLGALPLPLDWDRPWQKWPVSLVIGSLLGFVMGTGSGIVSAYQPQNWLLREDVKKAT